MVSEEGPQIDPGGAAGIATGSRSFSQKAQDWIKAAIADALAKRGGRTSLKVNGAQIGLAQHLDVQGTGATGEFHPELETVRVVLPSGGGSYVYVTKQVVSSPGVLIDFTDLPQDAKALIFRGKVKYNASTTNTGHEIAVRFNADDGSDYVFARHRHGRENSVNLHDHSVSDGASSGLDHIDLGRAPGTDSQSWDVGTFILELPFYADNDSKAKTFHGTSTFTYNTGETYLGYELEGAWLGGFDATALGPVTRVTFGISGVTDNFAVGSEIAVWKVLES